MGCSNSREEKTLNFLSAECNSLMTRNLEILTLIEYLLIGKNKLSASLSILCMKRRTKEYYEIMSSYRQFWISRSKNTEKKDNSSQISICETEIIKEKKQLMDCYETLEKCIEILTPNWKKDHESYVQYKSHLENLPHITQTSTTLYENYYTSEKNSIKSVMSEFNTPLEELEIDLIRKIKQVTVKLYKVPQRRVYFTKEIALREKESKHRNSIKKNKAKTPISEAKGYRPSINSEKPLPIRKNIRKSFENKVMISTSMLKSDANEKDDEDSEKIGRLSYTQK